MTDPRSPLALKIINANPDTYRALTIKGPTPESARKLLNGVTASQLLAVPIKSSPDAQAMLAALWLRNDDLHESHAIVQQHESSPSHSFWHAILHRREGDFGNSNYWMARCPNHPTLQTLAAQAPSLVNGTPADKSLLRLIMNGWNANAFVDLVEQVHDKPEDPRHNIAVALQRLEWQTLFDHCARVAAG